MEIFNFNYPLYEPTGLTLSFHPEPVVLGVRFKEDE